jgi:hypothetical protein
MRLEVEARSNKVRSIKITLFLTASAIAAVAGSAKFVIRGEISDTQCAMNVHSLSRSHEEMITKRTMGTDPASCAKACVKRGGEWVLRAGDKIYRLKNQIDVDRFAGKEVRVSGILDPQTDTIDNSMIEDANPPRKSN